MLIRVVDLSLTTEIMDALSPSVCNVHPVSIVVILETDASVTLVQLTVLNFSYRFVSLL